MHLGSETLATATPTLLSSLPANTTTTTAEASSASSSSSSLILLSRTASPIFISSSNLLSSLSSSTSSSSMSPSITHQTETAANTTTNTAANHLILNSLSSVTDDGIMATALTATTAADHNSISFVEDTCALQLALELSMVGISKSMQLQQLHQQQKQQHVEQQTLQRKHHQQQQYLPYHQKHMPQQQKHAKSLWSLPLSSSSSLSSAFDMNTLNSVVAEASEDSAATSTTCVNSSVTAAIQQLNPYSVAALLPPGIEERAKKSQNMTECVPVPSSEHVAEIVGRQGCKIKALRAKTNTYIKTPVRGEEPVFVVTGRKEDVTKAKQEIVSAAEHFSVIRASRKPSLAHCLDNSMAATAGSSVDPTPAPAAAFLSGYAGGSKTALSPSLIPGHVTTQVRVPYRVVGLVVGSKGATIKHIQQETQTYIVTPSREREPVFDVSGLPKNVHAARKQIEAHIAMRTGTLLGDEPSLSGGLGLNLALTGPVAASAAPRSLHTINSLSQILNDDVSPEFLASIYKNGFCSTFNYNAGNNKNNSSCNNNVSSIAIVGDGPDVNNDADDIFFSANIGLLPLIHTNNKK